jgi:hypothetical protein
LGYLQKISLSIHKHMSTVFVPYSSSSPFLHILSPPTGTKSPRHNLFHTPVLPFCKRKEWHFCLFKIAIQGVSLWHFCVYMYCNLNWFISSLFLLYSIVPFLWWFWQA